MNTIDRILSLCREKGIKQSYLNGLIGGYRGKFTDLKNGKTSLSGGELSVIAGALGVSPEFLLTGSNVVDLPRRQKGIRIPVLGRVVAGIPVEAIQEVIDYEEIDEDMAQTGEYFALSVKGDSMEPRICDGDVVIVRKQSDVDSGDIAIVMINGGDATVKKVIKNPQGVTLVPFNTAGYEPMMFSNRQIRELPVCVLGKVVELRAKF